MFKIKEHCSVSKSLENVRNHQKISYKVMLQIKYKYNHPEKYMRKRNKINDHP